MKKHFIFLAFLGAILHHISIAQVGNRYSYELFPLFQKSTTLIVLDDKETSYNRMMRKIIAEQWKVTPYEFVRFSEMNELLPAEGYSMLYKSRRAVKNLQQSKVQSHSDIALVMCNREKWSDFGGIDEIASVDLENIDDTANYVYKLPMLIGGVLQYLQYLHQEEIDRYNFDYPLMICLNKNVNWLKTKRLWVVKEELPVNLQDSSQFASAYPFPFQMASREQAKQIVVSKNSAAVLLYFTPKFHEVMALDIETNKIIYRAEPLRYEDFSIADVKKLAKRIK
ncbi:MAG: hypothetical protein ACKVTZ_04670 [Bacteroidia bacterium]